MHKGEELGPSTFIRRKDSKLCVVSVVPSIYQQRGVFYSGGAEVQENGWGFKCPLFKRGFTVHGVTEFSELYAELVFGTHLTDDPEYEFGKIDLPHPVKETKFFFHQLEVLKIVDFLYPCTFCNL